MVVTLTVTRTADTQPTTRTRTVTEDVSGGSASAPYRPTISSSNRGTSSASTTSAPSSTGGTQTGCPTGFYGCLATHGGGCCRTDRNCETYDCPAQPSTTIVSDGRTVVVPLTNLPSEEASATCAGGWFLCGRDAGPTAGCCPSGYECGTASCFTEQASQTGSVQKELPETDGSTISGLGWRQVVAVAGVAAGLLLI